MQNKITQWELYSPIIKKMLKVRGNIYMQRGKIDLDRDGNGEMLYRLSLYPYGACKNVDNTVGLLWMYFLDNGTKYSDSFNLNTYSMDPFLYDGKIYFSNPYYIDIGYPSKSKNEIGLYNFDLVPICSFFIEY